MTETPTEREQALELALQLMGSSAEQLAGTTDQLIDNYRHDADEQRATVEAIREGVEALLDGPWMPSPSALQLALWPSEKLINSFRREKVEPT